MRARVPGPLVAGQTVRLPEPVAHHLTVVRRLGAGATVRVSDGAGHEAEGTLTQAEGHWAVALGAVTAGRTAAPVTLCYGLAKGEKVDLVVRQATELGIARVVLVSCERSVVRLAGDRAVKRVARWARVAEAAAHQCGRADALRIDGPWDLAAALAESGPAVVFHPGAAASLAEVPPGESLTVFVGPEGGFSPAETAALTAAGVTAVALDTPVLRSETAALVACTLALRHLERL